MERARRRHEEEERERMQRLQRMMANQHMHSMEDLFAANGRGGRLRIARRDSLESNESGNGGGNRPWSMLPTRTLQEKDIEILQKAAVSEERRSCPICMCEYEVGD